MRELSASELLEILRLMWPQHAGAAAADHPDTLRWQQQGFEFQKPTSTFPLGLVQGHGGPCGVLAALQAELLRLFLFEYHEVQRRLVNITTAASREPSEDAHKTLQELIAQVAQAGEAGQQALLTEAIASLLVRCSKRPEGQQRAIHVVVLSDVSTAADEDDGPVYCESVVHVTSHKDPVLLRVIHEHLAAFQSPSGVMNFMFSALRTKGIAVVRAEMDDLDAAFTGQFGYCSQELLNFLLTGSAVSNVFDGSVPMGDTGLMLHGIPERSRIGYLTHLEALRYCQVGSYYKSPMYPVWVVGSTSHFSVCFGLDPAISDESTSQMLFQRVQRVFKSFDAMETGFMDISVLAESLQQLGVAQEILSNEYWMARLLGRLEVAGAGIVLWDEYWKVISVLLHTNDFELALNGNYQSSDSSQQQQQQQRPRSDSDIARELQAQFDSEGSGASSTSNPPAQPQQAPSQPAAPLQDEPPAEETFDLYYYNGLGSSLATEGSRRPQLAKCRITIPRKVDLVGKSVAIFETGTSGGYGLPPFEEIIKTKWPSVRIDWLGQPVPSID